MKELPHEAAARRQRQGKKDAQGQPATPAQSTTLMQSSTSSSMKHVNATSTQKKFSLETYKLHALGDYVQQICLFGPTDLYSTQIVSRLSSETAVGAQCEHLH